jgi:uncharacterized protein (TIGR03546 family)
MMVGLVPKGNLIALLLSMLLLSLRLNLAAGLLAAGIFSWIGMLIDPLTNRLGYSLLSNANLYGFWTWLYNLPLAPWTRFNNTVVLGSLLVGAWLFYPVYEASRWAAEQWRPWAAERLKKYHVGSVLAGAQIAARWRHR